MTRDEAETELADVKAQHPQAQVWSAQRDDSEWELVVNHEDGRTETFWMYGQCLASYIMNT
jgi:hypothetical protein